MHCEEPTCVSVCPVGAFTKTAEGPVLYDEAKCIGCRYCMQACPFQVPTYTWNEVAPRVRKCIFCHERLAQGMPTACAEACPTGATIFGERDELIPLKEIRKFYAMLPEPKELVVIDGADHLFDGKVAEVGDAIEDLLQDFND
jgi:formate dehydrogenase iron-sulfur subunit